MTTVKPRTRPYRACSVAALALPGILAAASAAAASTGDPVDPSIERRLRAELETVVSGLIESGALDATSARDLHLEVDSPPRQVTNLGLLVDSARSDDDGVHVLAVTPGSLAERIGMRTGDVIVAVDGKSLLGHTGAAAQLKRRIDDGAGPIAFGIRRDGREQILNGTLTSTYLPAMHLTIGGAIASSMMAASAAAPAAAASGCGRISDFDVAPRQQGLHGAKIISIDGETPGPQGSHSFRVGAGRHVVKVSEQIDAKYLPFNDRLRNAGPSANAYKTIEVEVAADTTNFVAAHLIEQQRTQWKDGAYWEPVAWKQVAETCR